MIPMIFCLLLIGFSFLVTTPKPGLIGTAGVLLRVALMLVVVAVANRNANHKRPL